MRILFSTRRLLLAFAVFASALAFFLKILPERNAINLMIGWVTATSAAFLALVVRRSDWPQIKVEITCSIFGVLMVFLFYPMPHRQFEAGDYIFTLLTTAFLGWLFGGIYARRHEILATYNQQTHSAPQMQCSRAECLPTSDGGRAESLTLALIRCLLVGTVVGLAGLAACVLMFLILLVLRGVGLLLLFILLPYAIYITWRTTGKILADELNRFRGAIAFGTRYLLMGAAIGLILKFFMGGEISDTPFCVFLGGAIGTFAGSIAGAFQGWVLSNKGMEAHEDS